MRNRIIFVLSGIGLMTAILSAWLFARQPTSQPPLFEPSANPYGDGVYAEGLIESAQSQGQNINIYPEVAGPITQVLVGEGQAVHKGDALVTIDDSVQRATAEQQRAQADAAQALLEELKAQPRPESLAVAAAQVDSARAALKSAADELAKQQRSYDLDHRSISLDVLDNAKNAASLAAANLTVSERQYDLAKAGAWVYDVQNQERQYLALSKAAAASAALLAKYTVRAQTDGVVLAVQSGVGSYVSPQGAYNAYTQGYDPLVTMATPQDRLQVRAYIDEILIDRLPNPAGMKAQMSIRGTNIRLPLTFVRVQPIITPKIELSNQRQERVDVRVLPVIFGFANPGNLHLYPGELVDVYVGAR